MKNTLDTHNMEYNSEKEILVIPEYGRNIQMLVNYAKTIEEPEFRQAFAEKIVDLMQQMHPQNRNIEDYQSKLWKHLFKIAKYDIEVIPSNGDKPSIQDDVKKPKRVEYPKMRTKFRHYGNNVQTLIDKALAMEEGPIKDGFVQTIGNYMKLAYRTWNKEHYVSDEIIKNDLKTLSGGKLSLEDGESLDNLSNANRRRKRPNGSNDRNDRNDRRNNGRNNNHRRNNRDNRGGSNNYRRR